jgi:hypothetical protein
MSVLLSGAPPAIPDALEATRDDDRKWFEAHRPRQYRIRPYIPGEMPELKLAPQPGRYWFVAVRQLETGVRMRRPFLAEGGQAMTSRRHPASSPPSWPASGRDR